MTNSSFYKWWYSYQSRINYLHLCFLNPLIFQILLCLWNIKTKKQLPLFVETFFGCSGWRVNTAEINMSISFGSSCPSGVPPWFREKAGVLMTSQKHSLSRGQVWSVAALALRFVLIHAFLHLSPQARYYNTLHSPAFFLSFFPSVHLSGYPSAFLPCIHLFTLLFDVFIPTSPFPLLWSFVSFHHSLFVHSLLNLSFFHILTLSLYLSFTRTLFHTHFVLIG